MHSAGGHVGVMKLYQMARSLFYWPNLIEDCIQTAKQCLHCKKLKEKPRVLPLKPTHKFDKPFQCWSIDYLPMLPESPEGYKHALLCVDPFSKWIEIFPMRTKASDEVWTVLYTQLFCRFGLPLELRCDRGREFSGVVQQKCSEFGVKLMRISVQNPKANGQAERYVQVVKRSIRTILSELDLQQCDWVECLAPCLVGLRFF